MRLIFLLSILLTSLMSYSQTLRGKAVDRDAVRNKIVKGQRIRVGQTPTTNETIEIVVKGDSIKIGQYTYKILSKRDTVRVGFRMTTYSIRGIEVVTHIKISSKTPGQNVASVRHTRDPNDRFIPSVVENIYILE